MTENTIEIDGKRFRRMQVGEVYDATCVYSYFDGGHVLYGTIHGSPAGQVRPATPYAYYAPVDRPPLIVETEHWRNLRDDEEVCRGDRVKTPRGVYFPDKWDWGKAASLVARVFHGDGVAQRRCGPRGEDFGAGDS